MGLDVLSYTRSTIYIANPSSPKAEDFRVRNTFFLLFQTLGRGVPILSRFLQDEDWFFFRQFG